MNTSNNNDSNDEHPVYDQPLLVGDRVESGYNKHDVFYQLRESGRLWLLYCNVDPIFADDPLWGDHYEEWLHACVDTPNHPRGLDKGWVIVDAKFDDETAIRRTLAETDRGRAKKEYQRAVLSIYDSVERMTSSEEGD